MDASDDFDIVAEYFDIPSALDRVSNSWIGPAIAELLRWYYDRGYCRDHVTAGVRYCLSFADYAARNGATRWTQLPDHVSGFLAEHVRTTGKNCTSERARREVVSVARAPIQQMLRLVLPGYVGLVQGRPLGLPFIAEAPGFFPHLREERGLSPRTINLYSHHLRSFERHLVDAGVAVSDLEPKILTDYVLKRSGELSKAHIGGLCSILRALLRYLYRQQVLELDLSLVVETPRTYRLAAPPRAIPWTDVLRILNSIDRRTASGKRDYALLILLATYGLRAREVAALTLDDIDWRNEAINVSHRKNGLSSTYPLAPAVGEAILDYLKRARPRTESRRIFITGRAPRKPIEALTVSHRASAHLKRVGIKVPRPGSHTFRHACAQRLVETDHSLDEIGGYLGHLSPSTTKIYAKLDIEKLREVALAADEVFE